MANENIQELKFQVGEAWKGVYSPSTAYGLANVVQDPTGLSIYRSLKSGNVGHPLSNASWWFRIIDLSSIKAESDRIAALNQSIAQDEALRVAAEELRQQHEAERVAAETQRNEAEQQRISAEQARVNAESARATAEQQRITAEQGRVSAESARVQAEQARVLAETLRANAEDQRAANEQNRVAAEQQRIERAEQDHQRAESDHATYVDSLGAFDISSYHATDGVLAKYADLTAALGTGGANIPDDLRKGGMSVKFVQSSDNKYVQYQLLATSFSTDKKDWQSISEIKDITCEYVESDNILDYSLCEIGSLRTSTGEEIEDKDNRRTPYISISTGDVIRAYSVRTNESVFSNWDTVGIWVYNSEGVLSRWVRWGRDITAQEGETLVRVVWPIGYTHLEITKNKEVTEYSEYFESYEVNNADLASEFNSDGSISLYTKNTKESRVDIPVANSSTTGLLPKNMYTTISEKIGISPVIVEVSTDGTKDYTSVRAAIEYAQSMGCSTTNQYEILIYEGEYHLENDLTEEEINSASSSNFVGIDVTNGITLKGAGKKSKTILSCNLSTSIAANLRGNISTLHLKGNCRLENLTITANNIRYVIHDDFDENVDSTHILTNCILRTYNTCFRIYTSYGIGLKSGQSIIANNCYFSHNFSFHDGRGSTYVKPSSVKLSNCTISRLIVIDDYGMDGLGNSFEMINCNYGGLLHQYDTAYTTQGFSIMSVGNSIAPIAAAQNVKYQTEEVVEYDAGDTITCGMAVQLADRTADSAWEEWVVVPCVDKNNMYGIALQDGVVGANNNRNPIKIQRAGYIDARKLGISSPSLGTLYKIDNDSMLTTTLDGSDAVAECVGIYNTIKLLK